MRKKEKIRHKRIGKKAISIRVKLWLEIGGKPFFGEGRVQLLKGIDQYGSINQAAKAANIPYRRAWSYLHAMEKRLGVKLLNSRVGGANGGGTELSNEAKEILYGFEQVSEYLERVVEKNLPDFFIQSRYAKTHNAALGKPLRYGMVNSGAFSDEK